MDTHEPKTGTTAEVIDGRISMVCDGRTVSHAAYCDYIMRGDWEARNREFIDSGTRVFHLTCPHGGPDYFTNGFWTDVGVYPDRTEPAVYPWTLDRQVANLLAMAPDARFLLKFTVSAPLGFTQKRADHMQTDEDGQRYREPTLASAEFLDGLGHFVRHVVHHCETRPWGNRMLGYLALPYGEGVMPLCIAGKMFDCSPVNDAAFQAWVAARYPTDAALQEAWHDPAARRETVRVPRDREWFERRRTAAATFGGQPLGAGAMASNSGSFPAGLFHWIEPGNAGREIDYCHFMRENFVRWVRTIVGGIKAECAALGVQRLAGLDITKQPLTGWQIRSAFDGIGDGQSAPNILHLSGSWGVGELLDDPDLDAIWTPADYHARTLGFAYEAEGVTDSLVLRNKVMMVENDARCYVGEGIRDQGAFRDDTEVEAGLLRNEALAISRNLHSYWCNVGSSYFHAPGIHRSVKRVGDLLDRLAPPGVPVAEAQQLPHRQLRDAIAFVIDDESSLHEDFTSGFQSLAVIWQRIRGLAHCGVPYRIFLLSDLRKDNFPDCKVYLFPNLFQIDAERLALLRRKVLRNGNIALFGPATGITDGRHLGAAGASQLLGVPMELLPRSTVRHVIVQDAGHPISAELAAAETFGDSLPYGPTLVPQERAVENNGAVPLGHANLCWFIHRTGLFLKEFGGGAAGNGKPGARGADDYAVLWSAALPLPASLLRATARYAGCHIWCEADDVIYASDSFVALHSVKAGRRVVKLPRACHVTDALTGRRIGHGVSEIRFHVKPPVTRLFLLDA